MRIRWRHHPAPPPVVAGPAGHGPVPAAAVLAHDLARAAARAAGRKITLDDLEAADRVAALLIGRWQPRPDSTGLSLRPG